MIAEHGGASMTSVDIEATDEVIQLLEETLSVSTRRVPTGAVRVSTRTETLDAIAQVEVDRYRVEITHVPVGRVVDEAPVARAEGDVTIIPMVEKRLVTVKQLVLVEEVRIRHVLERSAVSVPVALRRQRATVERLDGRGWTTCDEATSETTAALGGEGGHDGSIR
ncbi:YsnF/AvaK domain-containing protein [Lichenibacterium dinghuense]|uniref:YsnF/AvaK domain-containing protein n=1 Tax=Lichenibacterium dinghuense TaxID=2895977 RepID=UPI001F319AA3|nr:YsnF/AvaK domain-containing protein [Lichenibacterium sp. 6Y81]